MTLRRLTVAALLGIASVAPLAAQTPDAVDAAIRQRWEQLLSEEAQRVNKSLTGERLTASTDEKRAIYAAAVRRLFDEKLPVDNRPLVRDKVREHDRHYVSQLQTPATELKTAKSVDVRSTNPVTAGLSERSGFTELLALALTGQNFFNANDTAVTLNINALALFSLADSEVYSELFLYQQHSLARRFSGSVSFGAKVPEKVITGLSGLPDAEKVFDVFVWDVKLRLLGDRDPRSPAWYPLTLGRMSTDLVVITGMVPTEDAPLVGTLLNQVLGEWLTDLKRRIAHSLQLSFKTAGTHLTKENGRNKYTGELLFDMGLGQHADVTANLLYSVADDVRLGAAQEFQVKKWTVNASITTHFADNAIVSGRAVGWNSGFAVDMFQDKASLPISVDNTWKVFTTFEVPLSDAATIPLSVVYSNDPNALTKQKYVSGFLGINYDFSALGKLFKGN